jgi:hypothetical protein
MDNKCPCSFSLQAGERNANLNNIARNNEPFSRARHRIEVCSNVSVDKSDLLLDIFECLTIFLGIFLKSLERSACFSDSTVSVDHFGKRINQTASVSRFNAARQVGKILNIQQGQTQ